MRKFKLRAAIAVSLVFLMLFSCKVEESYQRVDRINEMYPILDKIESVDGNRTRNIRVYIIDSCEYIGHINKYHSDMLTHKGNCRFCAARLCR